MLSSRRKATRRAASTRGARRLCAVRPWHAGTPPHGNREISGLPDAAEPGRGGRLGPKAADARAREVRPAHSTEEAGEQAGRPGAELVEGRGRVDGNAVRQSTVRTLSREAVSQALARVRGAVKGNGGEG